MGLNFNYRIYVKKEKLSETFKYVFDKSNKEVSPIEFKDGIFYKVEASNLTLIKQNRIVIKDLMKEASSLGGFSFFFERDSKILEYLLRRACNLLDSEGKPASGVSIDDKLFSIGNIDVNVEDYSNKIPELIEGV